MLRLLWFGILLSLTACEPGVNPLSDNAFAAAKDLAATVVVDCAEADADFFSRAIWPLLTTTCAGCHSADAVAGSASTQPGLVFPNNATEAYSAVIQYLASHDQELSNKPSMNGTSHGGGRLFSTESTEIAHFAELTQRVQVPAGACQDSGGRVAREPGFADVINISATRTARKAALLLQGRLPSSAELAQAQIDDDGLRAVLLAYLQGRVFEQWLMTSANDQLLTRKYLTGQSEAQAALSGMTYQYSALYERTQSAFDAADLARTACTNAGGVPAADAAEPDCQAADNAGRLAGIIYDETQRAIAEEPLQLIRHVVAGDRPYSEVLTADYMMMNPFSYEVLDGQTWTAEHDSMAADDWRPGHIRRYQYGWSERADGSWEPDGTLQVKTGLDYLPSAGLLSSPVFLLRYPSTDTNRNRARARWTYYFFLGVDIERLAVRAMDPEELKRVTNPGAEGSSCFGCHQLMDPVAGAFQSWANGSEFLVRGGLTSLPLAYQKSDPDFLLGDQWYSGQLAAGFNGADLPTLAPYGAASTHPDGLQWLSEQLVADNRFATGTAKFWFKGVFGREPLPAPTAAADADYSARLQAYQDEQSLLLVWAERFRSADLNLKSLLVEMLMSPLYRAEALVAADTDRALALQDLGLGRLLTPEQLDRKVVATLGYRWKQDWQSQNQLLEDYYMFYGGIDSDGITERTASLNSLMYSVAERMANELACEVVAQAFWPGMAAGAFAGVEIDTDPASPAGELAIRKVIDELLWRLWGVVDTGEQTALWQLYQALYDQRQAWTEVSNFLDVNDADDALDEFCWIRDADPDDGVDIAVNWTGIDWNDEASIRAHLGSLYNPEQTLRPWVGLLTVMLTDPQFLTE